MANKQYISLNFIPIPLRSTTWIFGPDTFLGEAEFTRVPIRNIFDKFNILTDKKLLEIILDEYITYLRKGTAYGSREYTIEKAERP